MVRYKISNQLSSQERTKFTETRNGLSWRHTPFDTSIKLTFKSHKMILSDVLFTHFGSNIDSSVRKCAFSEIHLFPNKFDFARDSSGTQLNLSFLMLPDNRMCCARPLHVPTATIFEISRYMHIQTELRATGPTVQWREVSDENDIPLYNRPTDRLCDWVLGKLWLIWSNFCVKKIICSGRVGETTASVKIYSPSRIYRHLCPDMEDKGTREFALKQLNSPPEVLNGVSFKFI
ncbi:hypothetical protein T265_12931, partial [Opisthorchis viverrini]